MNLDIIRNLTILYNSTNPSRRFEGLKFWNEISDKVYREARTFHIPDKILCGMTAILSPGVELKKALEYSLQIADELKRGYKMNELTLLGAYGWNNLSKAAELFLTGKVDLISGNKVVNTYELLVRPNRENVSIGRNEKRAAYNDFVTDDSKLKISPKEYEFLAEHYRYAAGELNLRPCDLQAVINIQVKEYFARTLYGVIV